MNKFLITIVGPTAIGKTSLAIKLAKHYQTEVISADSRQFYKELNIGTAKPTSEELSSVKHHLINNISVTDDYDISQFQSDARKKINNVFKMKDFAIMVGAVGATCWIAHAVNRDDKPLLFVNSTVLMFAFVGLMP